MTDPVDAWLSRAPADQRVALVRLRDLILEAAPDSVPVIRIGVPQFRWRNRPLVSIGSAKRHVSLFIMYSGVLRANPALLEGHDHTDTVVRFRPDVPIPADLVRALVRARQAEIERPPQT